MMTKTEQLKVKEICSNLRNRRISLGFTQNYVKSISGIDPCRIESGETEPGLSRFISLCKGLKVSPGLLLLLSEKNDTNSLSDKILLDVIRNWDDYEDIFMLARKLIFSGIQDKYTREKEAV